jgi:hypothetical protein
LNDITLKSLRFAVFVGTLTIASAVYGQLSNPIPAPITKQGLRIQLEDVVQFPNSLSTLGSKPDQISSSHARINFFREAPDGRMFVNDLRGQLYCLDQNMQPQLYLDIDANNGGAGSIFPASWYANGLASGFISFEFHPEFESNGLFYTIHSERAINTTAVPDFSTTDLGNPNQAVTYHTVITEWNAANPAANTWNAAGGSRREVLRVGTTATAYFHPYGDLQFNPNSKPGDDDYGQLYISGGDWGYINGAGAPQDPDTEGQPGQLQRLDTLAGTLIRIDPRSPSVTGGQAGLGDYTIPASNPFVDGNPQTFDEIYAFGFRNGHRMAWDNDGTLIVNNVGHAQLEEIERIIPGGNYGWVNREGTFVNGNDLASGGNGDADDVFANNVPDALDVDFRGEEYLYPMAQFDHGEGAGIAGGFVYHGTQIPQLYGKYIFGDIVTGRIFATDMAAMKDVDITSPGPTAPIEEIQLFTKNQFGVENDIDLRPDYFGGGRVDIRFGVDSDGELWLMTKEDGYLRKLVGPGPTLALYVDPFSGQAILRNASDDIISLTGYSVVSDSLSILSNNWNSLADQNQAGWNEAPTSTASLSELNPFDELVLAPGDRFNLGHIFDVNGDQDLAFEFLLADGTNFQIGAVLYRAAADFNFDGDVDAEDLQLWQSAYGVNGSADADGDGDSDGRDFLVWQRQVEQPALLAAASTSVPEPSTMISMLLGLVGYCGFRRGSR